MLEAVQGEDSTTSSARIAPCTSSTLAFAWPLLAPAGAASAAEARPEAWAAAKPARAAVPFNTARRVVPIGFLLSWHSSGHSTSVMSGVPFLTT
jgi:hypothetical protein